MRKKCIPAVKPLILIFMIVLSMMPVPVSAAEEEETPADIIITPESITGYVGGDSLNGGHSPKLRFSVELPAGVSMDDLSYKIYTETNGTVSEGEELEASAINDTYYLFPQLGAGFEGEEGNTEVQRGNYLKLVDDGTYSDSLNGTYTVMKRTGENADWDDWYIKATDGNDNEYTVDVTEGSTVFIREVSTETDKTIYEDINSYATPIVTSDNMTQDELNVSIEAAMEAAESGMAIAVEKEDTSYNYETNGQSQLGVIGNDGSEDTAEIALLFDNLMVDSYSNSQIEDRIEEEGYDYYEMKYLDLINIKDGNAVVTTDKKIDIYWPYPEGITKEDAEEMCDFEILHFDDMDRDYTTNSSDPSVGEVETIIPECTDYGLKFSTKSFSPYVLVWKVTTYPVNGVLKIDGPAAETVSIDDEQPTVVQHAVLGAGLSEDEPVSAEEIVGEDASDRKRIGELPETGETEDVSLWKAMMLMCVAGAVTAEGFRRRISLRRK
jgi:hypothetical protein